MQARAETSSEAASLKGHLAKTPIIAGTICGFFLVLGWTLSLISCLVRQRREKIREKKVAAGLKSPRPVIPPPEKYIIPPDPAVVLGQRQPGERVVVEEKHRFGHHKHAKSTSKGGNDEIQPANTNGLVHTATEPLSDQQDTRAAS